MFNRFWLPVIVWAGLIFALSSIPNLKSDLEYDFLLRKIAHVTEYFILTLLLYRAFKNTVKPGILGLFAFPTLISVLYAASDELHQTFVKGRHGDIKDVMIDSIGIFGLYLALMVLYKIKMKKVLVTTLGLLIFLAMTGYAQGPQVNIDDVVAKMKKDLGLSDEQAVLVKPIIRTSIEKYQEYLEGAQADATPDKKMIKVRTRQFREEEDEQLGKVLTADQMARLISKRRIREGLNKDQIDFSEGLGVSSVGYDNATMQF